MKTNFLFLSLLLVVTAVLSCQIKAVALGKQVETEETIRKRTARNITVEIIDGQSIFSSDDSYSGGSGVLMGKKDEEQNTYYIITNQHVKARVCFKVSNCQAIITPVSTSIEQAPAPENLRLVQEFPNPDDLALFEFTQKSSQTSPLTIAVQGDVTKLRKNDVVYVAGFPKNSTSNQEERPNVVTLFITNEPTSNVGQLLTYKPKAGKNAESGMSGGPILNQQNQLIGIHTQQETKDPTNPARQGVTINTILAKFPQLKQAPEFTEKQSSEISISAFTNTLPVILEPAIIIKASPINQPFKQLRQTPSGLF